MIEKVTLYVPPDWTGYGPRCSLCRGRYVSLGAGAVQSDKTMRWAEHIVECDCRKEPMRVPPEDSTEVGIKLVK